MNAVTPPQPCVLSLGAWWMVVESLYGMKGFLEPPWAGRGSNPSDSYPRVGRFWDVGKATAALPGTSSSAEARG
jgi:hypothetical protein